MLTVSGAIRLWEVYAFAFALGCVTAFDAPARQAFVSDLVPEADLANAVGLNSTSFNAARLIGPAVAGAVIAAVGTGWVFVINAASFIAMLGSLALLRTGEFHAKPHPPGPRGGLVDGFRYVRRRPDLMAIFFMLFLIGTFGLNFPIFISTMAVSVFHKGAGEFGFLTTVRDKIDRDHALGPRLLLAGLIDSGIGCLEVSLSGAEPVEAPRAHLLVLLPGQARNACRHRQDAQGFACTRRHRAEIGNCPAGLDKLSRLDRGIIKNNLN